VTALWGWRGAAPRRALLHVTPSSAFAAVVVVLMLEEVVFADVAGDPRKCLLDFSTVER
jgi:hypothetical protein